MSLQNQGSVAKLNWIPLQHRRTKAISAFSWLHQLPSCPSPSNNIALGFGFGQLHRKNPTPTNRQHNKPKKTHNFAVLNARKERTSSQNSKLKTLNFKTQSHKRPRHSFSRSRSRRPGAVNGICNGMEWIGWHARTARLFGLPGAGAVSYGSLA